MPRLGHICWLTALALSAAAVEPPPAFPGVLVTPHPGVAAPLPAGVGVGVGRRLIPLAFHQNYLCPRRQRLELRGRHYSLWFPFPKDPMRQWYR